MARRSGTHERILYKHGLLWWCGIGVWWRPLAWVFSYFTAEMGNRSKIRTTVVDKPFCVLTVRNHQHGILWWIFIGWWWRIIKYGFFYFLRMMIYMKLRFIKVP